MTRIPPLSHSMKSIRPTVHRGVCPRTKRSNVPHANIIRDPKKGEKPKKIWIYCPGEDFSWSGQFQVHSVSANDNNWLS